MKTCIKCKEEKPLSEYDKKNDKVFRSYCKDCRRKYVNEHYKKNTEYYKKKARKRNANQAKDFMAYKETLACTDCGLSFAGKPYLCDFHHTDPLVKDVEVSTMRTYSLKALMKEISKCVPLCANCHRTRHHL